MHKEQALSCHCLTLSAGGECLRERVLRGIAVNQLDNTPPTLTPLYLRPNHIGRILIWQPPYTVPTHHLRTRRYSVPYQPKNIPRLSHFHPASHRKIRDPCLTRISRPTHAKSETHTSREIPALSTQDSRPHKICLCAGSRSARKTERAEPALFFSRLHSQSSGLN